MKHLLLAGVLLCSTAAFAEETMGEKAKTGMNETGSSMNKAGRKVSDKFCETTKGKNDAECIAKKAKHGAQNMGDKVHDKAVEVKDKVD